MFERLTELVHVVSKNKIQRIEILGESNNYDSLVHKLYKGIQEGKFQTAEEAAKTLYDSSPEDKNFKHLQFALERRLLNTIFFIDVNKPSFTELTNAYYTCQKNVAAVHILIGRAASQNAISLAERTIRQAIKYEFTDIIVSLARFLKLVFAFNSQKKKKYQYYDSLLNEHMALLQAEMFAEDCYQKVTLYHSTSVLIHKEMLQEVVDYANKLEALLVQNQSYKFCLPAYLTIVNRYEIEQDYPKIIATCDKAIDYFSSNSKRASNTAISNFLFKKVICQTTLKRYKEAEVSINRCLEYAIEGGRNWYKVLNQYFILSMQSKNYQKAYELLIIAQNSSGFKRLFPVEKEIWEVYAAYVHYFIRIKKIEAIEINGKNIKKFRYFKFLNDVPIFSKDKRGVNIAILILQVLLLLEAKKYDDVIDRADALNQYCFKYLKKDDSYRSNCFIKMLIKLIDAHFHKNGAIRKAQAYLEKLKAHPLEVSLQKSEVEIVPYEDLWEYLLNTVDYTFIKQKKSL